MNKIQKIQLETLIKKLKSVGIDDRQQNSLCNLIPKIYKQITKNLSGKNENDVLELLNSLQQEFQFYFILNQRQKFSLAPRSA